MKDYTYELLMKVRDYECDLQGIVNNANYQHYLEHTRHEFLLSIGLSFADMSAAGYDFVISKVTLNYKSPLRSRDEFRSQLYVTREGIKCVFHQEIVRVSDGKVFVHVNTHLNHTNNTARTKQAHIMVKLLKQFEGIYFARGAYQFPEKLIPLFINNIRHRKPLPVYGKGENVRDWLYVEDHARAIDLIFHEGKVAETYNIGGFNEWKNIDIIKVVINTVDRLLGRKEGEDMDLITYVTDRAGHDLRYAIDSRKLKAELGWQPCLQFEEGIEKTVKWYLENQEWMDNITSGEYEKYYEEMYADR